MKKNTKRVLALIAATVMSCTMVTGFANTASITKVEVLNTDGTAVLWSYDSAALAADPTINADASNLVKVYTQITDGAETPDPVSAIESTFLSHSVEAGTAEVPLDNTNIMFVDQKPTNEDGIAFYTFRPRTGYIGTYVAKTGGEGVAAAVSENYTVAKADVQWALAGENNNVEIGSTANLVFNFDLPINAVMPAALTSVKVGDADAAYAYDAAAKTLTLTEGYPAEAGTTYTVTVVAANYATVTANYVVKAAPVVPDVEIEEGDEEAVEGGIDNAVADIPDAPVASEDGNALEVTLPTVTITGANDKTYTVEYSVPADSAVKVEDGKLTWNYNVAGAKFAERVTVTAKVADKAETKEIFFIKPNTKVAFGNALAIAAADGTDAFATQDSLAKLNDADPDVVELRARVLNMVFNGKDVENVAQFENSLDLNGDTEVALSEYYIIKRMIENRAIVDEDENPYSVAKVNKK